MLRAKGVLLAFLVTPLLALGSGCGLMPSDPADPPAFGARISGGTITVKAPLCPADRFERIDVSDADDVGSETPKTLWWASGPQTRQAKAGLLHLWSGQGFAHHAPAPASTPDNLNVGYTDSSGDGRDDVLPLQEIAKAKLGPGDYWTHDGPKTAAEIDAQLSCADR
ncbi:hypothetical protein AB0E88_02165 [Streptomyces sp. NPDC028635]|uniref:hypothetical protein n=1 Tax=Streptomyces sp. NPDC028635 TaxID=3154800 RepID=UPI0033D54735